MMNATRTAPCHSLMVRVLAPLAAMLSLLGACGGPRSMTSEEVASAAAADDGTTRPCEPHPPGRRVAGDMQAAVERRGAYWISGKQFINTPLPAGYPAPTPAGAIEIKSYPAVRRAQVTRTGDPDWGMNWAFWPLFQHIKKRNIAMTSPVEMNYRGLSPDGRANPESWTMSFLYREQNLGPTGADRNLEVVDAEPLTVVAVGFMGQYRLSRVREHYRLLEDWLASQAEWERAGEPRALCYNGPEQRDRYLWGEVQVPIRRRTPAAAGPGPDQGP